MAKRMANGWMKALKPIINILQALSFCTAETLVSKLDCQTMIARCSGIYGPGRARLISKIKQAAPQALLPIKSSMSNRIHVIDLARALIFLNQLKHLPDLINISDTAPTPLPEIATWLAKKIQRQDIQWQAAKHDSSARPQHHRKIASQRLQALGFKFQFPDYRTGFQSILEAAA